MLLAAGLRFAGLGKSPPAVNWDEAALGYNAYSLWLTGKDEYGYKMPLALRSFEDYKPPLYAYLTAPIVGMAELNEFNTRLVSAIAGVASVALVFLITNKLVENEVTAVTAAGLRAMEPWSILFSRGAWEANLALAISLATVYLLVLGERKMKYYFAALVLAGVNVLAYHSAKIYLPLVGVWIVYRLKGKIFAYRYWWIAAGAAFLPLVYGIASGSSLTRFSSTSILKVWRQEKSIYSLAANMADRYFAYFSPVNLFVRGSNEPNQNITGFAPFYTFEFGFWAIGMYYLLTKPKKYPLLTAWVISGSLPAVLTWSWFTPVRVLPLFAAFSIVSAIGISQLFTHYLRQGWKKLVTGATFASWGFINVCWLFNTIWFYVPYAEYGKWQWGFRETMAEITPIIDKYDRVVWETPQAQPHIFTLFYGKYPPEKYQHDLGSPEAVPANRQIFDYGKFVFRKIYWPKDRDEKGVLFIGSVYSLPETDLKRDGIPIIKEVIDPQGFVVYRIAGT
ncbi:MAG: hypothetical protein UX78_C0003G0067 [Candidatus Amesbacteria bacterium GW2011_GWA2_47_11]|uniref:Glycosyltransferase RgtA/B/C/D-like domain-containing protein n=1 Tax=Candidatus Amesbacteria bacterium GW2011_GWA2_47_11 TaxID=1618357 RepID=A0A0G1RI15_9BACT|nr:MAG: hypothetical protein UX78_C0003G0067 [Candidatus Amesbacteria bacterium GW2011_GWA2_47_11]